MLFMFTNRLYVLNQTTGLKIRFRVSELSIVTEKLSDVVELIASLSDM